MYPVVALCWVQDGIFLMLASGLSMMTIGVEGADATDNRANRKDIILRLVRKLTLREGTVYVIEYFCEGAKISAIIPVLLYTSNLIKSHIDIPITSNLNSSVGWDKI
ncbi:hypothetical protein G6F33_005075 [Rhizopus arrhizus]|nr:hypothetical protein G6F33_005075 [Rhizopus arrhizus]